MQEMRNRRGLLFVTIETLLALLASACASGPALEKYPRRQIDRPYTLPKGVATWNIPAITSYSRDTGGNITFIPPIPIPLIWQEALSDDWQLTWAPLPLAISHQFTYDDTGFWGAGLGLSDVGYGSIEGWFLNPTLTTQYRRKLTDSFALDTQLVFSPEIQFSGGPFTWGATVQVAAFFQLSPTVALSAGPGVSVGNTAPDLSGTFVGYPGTTAVTVPLTANFYWSFHRQWDFNVGYSLDRIGEPGNAFQHEALIEFVHFW